MLFGPRSLCEDLHHHVSPPANLLARGARLSRDGGRGLALVFAWRVSGLASAFLVEPGCTADRFGRGGVGIWGGEAWESWRVGGGSCRVSGVLVGSGGCWPDCVSRHVGLAVSSAAGGGVSYGGGLGFDRAADGERSSRGGLGCRVVWRFVRGFSAPFSEGSRGRHAPLESAGSHRVFRLGGQGTILRRPAEPEVVCPFGGRLVVVEGGTSDRLGGTLDEVFEPVARRLLDDPSAGVGAGDWAGASLVVVASRCERSVSPIPRRL